MIRNDNMPFCESYFTLTSAHLRQCTTILPSTANLARTDLPWLGLCACFSARPGHIIHGLHAMNQKLRLPVPHFYIRPFDAKRNQPRCAVTLRHSRATMRSASSSTGSGSMNCWPEVICQ